MSGEPIKRVAEKLALMNLAELAPNLTAEQKKEILQEMDSIPEKEAHEQVERRETALGVKNIGRIRGLLTRKMTQETNERYLAYWRRKRRR